MVVVYTIAEMDCLVISIFYDFVRILLYLLYICNIELIGCAICLVFRKAREAAMPSTKSFIIL